MFAVVSPVREPTRVSGRASPTVRTVRVERRGCQNRRRVTVLFPIFGDEYFSKENSKFGTLSPRAPVVYTLAPRHSARLNTPQYTRNVPSPSPHVAAASLHRRKDRQSGACYEVDDATMKV